MIDRDRYFYWLTDKIDALSNPFYLYSKVLYKLFETPFYDLVDNDCNRVSDGLDLRNEFAEEMGEHLYFVIEDLPRECSCLEMMIALARKWDDWVAYNKDIGDRTDKWFWIMMNNLGLSHFTNGRYDDIEVSHIIYIFVSRKYNSDGTGGLFMVKNFSEDLTKVEIWYQMNYFFRENPELIV